MVEVPGPDRNPVMYAIYDDGNSGAREEGGHDILYLADHCSRDPDL